MKRQAKVTGARAVREVAAYLPDNYRVVAAEWQYPPAVLVVTVEGEDASGWTLDGYVQPRLASGNMACEEVLA